MGKSKSKRFIVLDGSTGEGGGQLVRVALALAAVTAQSVKIVNIRAKRSGGGGLKGQHVTAVRFLALLTGATVAGGEVGSRTLEFAPTLAPAAALAATTASSTRCLRVVSESRAASAMLVFQAVLPFLLYNGVDETEGKYKGNEEKSEGSSRGNCERDERKTDKDELMKVGYETRNAIELEIEGGTNVSFSPGWEYVDQVLLPVLADRFGIRIERELRRRGWDSGPQDDMGCVWFRIDPLRPGQSLSVEEPGRRERQRVGDSSAGGVAMAATNNRKVTHVDVSIVVPAAMHEGFRLALAQDVAAVFADVEITFPVVEDSGHDSRVYVLLVARSATSGLRWGHQVYTSASRAKGGRGGRSKKQQRQQKQQKQQQSTEEEYGAVAAAISRTAVQGLREEMAGGAQVDRHLQDQLVSFQALARGRSEAHGPSEEEEEEERDTEEEELTKAIKRLEVDEPTTTKAATATATMTQRADRAEGPFGQGSTHTQTVRWVVSELLPGVKFYRKGTECEGVGVSA